MKKAFAGLRVLDFNYRLGGCTPGMWRENRLALAVTATLPSAIGPGRVPDLLRLSGPSSRRCAIVGIGSLNPPFT